MVKEVFYLDGVVGKAKADFTLRACITASDRSAVPTANLTITEIAGSNGGYEVAHPDYSEDLILFLVLTTDTSKYAAIRLSAATGIIPAVPGAAMTLTVAYDAAKTAAQRADVTAARDAVLAEAGAIVALPVMQGSIYTATAAQQTVVQIIRGDTPRIYFDLAANYTGWTIWLGAKAALSDAGYAIAVKQGVWTDATKGQGYIDLTSAETATVRKLLAEIELRSAAQTLTAMKFVLDIKDDVIK